MLSHCKQSVKQYPLSVIRWSSVYGWRFIKIIIMVLVASFLRLYFNCFPESFNRSVFIQLSRLPGFHSYFFHYTFLFPALTDWHSWHLDPPSVGRRIPSAVKWVHHRNLHRTQPRALLRLSKYKSRISDNGLSSACRKYYSQRLI